MLLWNTATPIHLYCVWPLSPRTAELTSPHRDYLACKYLLSDLLQKKCANLCSMPHRTLNMFSCFNCKELVSQTLFLEIFPKIIFFSESQKRTYNRLSKSMEPQKSEQRLQGPCIPIKICVTKQPSVWTSFLKHEERSCECPQTGSTWLSQLIQGAGEATITYVAKFKPIDSLMYLVLAPFTGWRELLNYYSLKGMGPEYQRYGRVPTKDFITHSAHDH